MDKRVHLRQTYGVMRYGLLLLATLFVGCQSKPEETTSTKQQNQPADVAAIRGSGSEVKTPAPISSGFAAGIEGDLTALKHAKSVAADADAKIKREDKQNAAAGQ